MITLLRRIRQKLIDSGSVTKYLLYATGEILLVVVGILIALQVNNWNEEKRALTQLESNFQNLVEDIQSNKEQLLELKEFRTESVDGASYLIDHYEAKKQISENEFISKLYSTLREEYFEINRKGIDKVVSSEAYERDEMEEIRELIQTYLRNAGTLYTYEVKENNSVEEMEMITAGNGYFRTVWRSFRNKRYLSTTEYNNPDFDFLELMENDELLYILFRYEFVSPFHMSRYDELIRKGDEILVAVEQYRSSD
ncbi:DUF6090 family protein [Balneola sp. MJW-20]|uniref:DUF6090 family protein n=1 Tax=Gracilimonas aurantiaca TaxID=3234185 RepID=UPI003466B6EB